MMRLLSLSPVPSHRLFGSLAALLIVVLGLWTAPPAHADTLTVTTAADSGPGSLRQALETARPGDVITFDPAVFPPDSPATITLLSLLPPITQGDITIDATHAGVILDGTKIGQQVETLYIDDVSLTVDGVSAMENGDLSAGLSHWVYKEAPPRTAVQVVAAPAHSVPGALALTTMAVAGQTIVYYDPGSPGGQLPDPLERPLYEGSTAWIAVSPGSEVQVSLWYQGAPTGLVIDGRFAAGEFREIGTQFVPPSAGWAQIRLSVRIPDGVTHIALELRHQQSQSGDGLRLASDGNVVMGLEMRNFGQNGIRVSGNRNTIGGRNATPGERCSGSCNAIGGSGGDGIWVEGADNVITGNYIGIDRAGAQPLPNAYGIWVNASGNRIGGGEAGEGNLIVSNTESGLTLLGPGATGNVVRGNWVGTDPSGVTSVGNAGGIVVMQGASGNEIGPGNLVAYNRDIGIALDGVGTSGNRVFGNRVLSTVGDRQAGITVRWGAAGNRIGPGNVIAGNPGPGVVVVSSASIENTITENAIYGNESAIALAEGGNGALPAPTLIVAAPSYIRGTAVPDADIELYTDAGAQARTYLGSCRSDAGGAFAFTIPFGTALDRNITALASDAHGNSSALSTPLAVAVPVALQGLPGIVAPGQVSTDPRVAGTNALLALVAFLFFGLTSNLFNSTLEGYTDEISAALQHLARLRPAPGHLTGRRLLALWPAVVLAGAAIESFLDPTVAWHAAQLGLVASLTLSGLTMGALKLGVDVLVRRGIYPSKQVAMLLHASGIILAAASVVVSRLMHFTPGYIYGIVGALYLLPELEGRVQVGRRALLVTAGVLGGAFVAWLVSPLLAVPAPDAAALLATLFVVGLQTAFFSLFPIAPLEGYDIRRWNRAAWAVAFLVVFFLFFHLVLNPASESVNALRANGVRTLLVLMGMWGALTVGLWLAFPFRLRHRP